MTPNIPVDVENLGWVRGSGYTTMILNINGDVENHCRLGGITVISNITIDVLLISTLLMTYFNGMVGWEGTYCSVSTANIVFVF